MPFVKGKSGKDYYNANPSQAKRMADDDLDSELEGMESPDGGNANIDDEGAEQGLEPNVQSPDNGFQKSDKKHAPAKGKAHAKGSKGKKK